MSKKLVKSLLSRWSHIRRQKLPLIDVHLSTIEGPHNFVEPNPDFRAIILDGSRQEVGIATFGLSPLGDAIYVYRIDVHMQHRRQGYALAFLRWAYNEYQLPITPIHIVGSALGFWSAARGLSCRDLIVKNELRTGEMAIEKGRWAHLIPEPEHIRLQRVCEASPTWLPDK